MRDQTRKVMKAQLDATKGQIDNWDAQIVHLNGLVQAAKDERDRLKAERDLIKADLDAEPEVNPLKKAASKETEVEQLEEMLNSSPDPEMPGPNNPPPGFVEPTELDTSKPPPGFVAPEDVEEPT